VLPGLWLLALVPGASASNTRVAISGYAWSAPQVQIDRGERVTWDWIGPDLIHSVTGTSTNASQWDSNPGTQSPSHRAGDSFTVQFDQPGAYFFQCKLHASVRGAVIVSALPGNPGSDPGPQAPLRVDRRAPTLGTVTLARPSFRGSRGVGLSAQVSERGLLDAEYYRLDAEGRRTYKGYATWRSFIGINHFRLAARWKRFRAAPGRYEAVLRAVDAADNVSAPVRKRFTIVP